MPDLASLLNFETAISPIGLLVKIAVVFDFIFDKRFNWKYVLWIPFIWWIPFLAIFYPWQENAKKQQKEQATLQTDQTESQLETSEPEKKETLATSSASELPAYSEGYQARLYDAQTPLAEHERPLASYPTMPAQTMEQRQ